MARNKVQFQDGMSLTRFMALYGTEEQCEAAVKRWRWPNGFVCPKCGAKRHTITGRRRLYECRECGRQTSLKAGTIFAKSLVPLAKWFQAMWLITQSKGSISTLELSRQLGLKWDSAWLLRQKLAHVMSEDESALKLDGRVEMDDAVWGGEKGELDGGKRGRGGPNKVPFVVAVATSDDGRPLRLMLHVVARHSSVEIEKMARAHLATTARVVSDGLACFRAVTKAGCGHQPIVTSRAPEQAEKIPAFRWVNTVLGNVKTAIHGTFHALRRPYVARYFAEFQWRFNRRFDLAGMFDKLLRAVVAAKPTPYAAITRTYVGG